MPTNSANVHTAYGPGDTVDPTRLVPGVQVRRYTNPHPAAGSMSPCPAASREPG
jgi:hypothetical protein